MKLWARFDELAPCLPCEVGRSRFGVDLALNAHDDLSDVA